MFKLSVHYIYVLFFILFIGCLNSVYKTMKGSAMDKFNPTTRKIVQVMGAVALLGCAFTQQTLAEENWKLSLKNAYIDRDFDNDAVKDTGSWSQGVSLFYTSDYQKTPFDQLEIGLDASAQYAIRLSSDKHVSDSVLPFDSASQSQADDFKKYGGTLKLKYQDNVLRVGELWLDTPLTSVDGSRQLLSSYMGANFNSKVNDQLGIEVGHVSRVSARNEEDFEKFSYTKNGVKHESDGLTYVDVRYKFNDALKGEYYFGNLSDLFDLHYVGLDHTLKMTDDLALNSKVKYFNAQDNSKALQLDTQNVGILETVKYKNHSLGLGYQQIIGHAYPLLDGFMPETYFINWNVTGFAKEEEKSYHAIYSYNFKDQIPGLNAIAKYAYGTDIKMADGRKNKESELDLILAYQIQHPMLKGTGFQYMFVDYDVDHGNDFQENRVFLTYTKKF